MRFSATITLLLSLFYSASLKSQSIDLERLHLGLGLGFTNYYGDLEQSEILFRTNTAGFGAFMSYELLPNISLRGGFNYGKVSAEDRNNRKPVYVTRNLSFETSITEVNLLMEFSVFDLSRFKLSPYAFGGIAGYHFNPYAYDQYGDRIYLQPLGTEGQGSIPGKKPYSLYQFSIPFGGGIRYNINGLVMVGIELGWRRLFTDYLDDVGGPYAPQSSLIGNAKAYEMAFRTPEVSSGVTYSSTIGINRGDPSNKDWYAFYNLNLSMNFKSLKTVLHRYKSDVKCPDF